MQQMVKSRRRGGDLFGHMCSLWIHACNLSGLMQFNVHETLHIPNKNSDWRKDMHCGMPSGVCQPNTAMHGVGKQLDPMSMLCIPLIVRVPLLQS